MILTERTEAGNDFDGESSSWNDDDAQNVKSDILPGGDLVKNNQIFSVHNSTLKQRREVSA